MNLSRNLRKSRRRYQMNTDEIYMRKAIRLARTAWGLTSPNPVVGAVIVKGAKIVGSGYHKRCGMPHAEINALKEAGPKAKGATLYVTLEPCDHFGRTPPCTDAVIKSGIKKVVMGMKDPNPVNNGKGIKKLRANGIKTVIGVLEKDATRINRPFIKFITKNIPYVTVKVAGSLDGKIATRSGDSKWITSEDSRRYVHRLRGRVDAVVVGVNTVIKDNPMLISRASGARQPSRIIVDSRLKTPLSSRLFSNIEISPLIIATTKNISGRKRMPYEKKGARILSLKAKGSRVDLKALLKALAGMEMTHLLVEGGGELIWSFIEEGLVDEFLFFMAPKIIGGKDAVTAVEGNGFGRIKEAVVLKNLKIKHFKEDILIKAEVA